MKITKDLNTLSKNEFITIFGSIFEKSEWIANETFELKPFKNSKDLVDKMINIYDSCSIDKILKILNLHPKLAIEKKLSSFSSKEQTGAELDKCSKEELIEFNKLNFDYEKKFKFPFIIAVKGKNKDQILENFRIRIKNNYEEEFQEAKKQVTKIALFRLNEILEVH
jgi:OHCU decarboxylase|tara:strand:- start:802 stop:1302 length:501 start_codon:yes stop_codon:yes gene_type:complete